MKDYLIGAGYALIAVVMCAVISALLVNLMRVGGYNTESIMSAGIFLCIGILVSVFLAITRRGEKK